MWNTLQFRGVVGQAYNIPAIYDQGIPVKEHVAYWADSPADRMYRDTSTAYNPTNVIVNNTNVYAVVDKRTPGTYLDVGVDSTVNSALRVQNLPPDTIFSVSANGTRLVVGSTGSSGSITLPYTSSLFTTIVGLELNVFHDSLVAANPSGMVVFDHHNHEVVNMQSSRLNNTAYIMTKYIELPIPLDDTRIDGVAVGAGDCGANTFDLPYLSGTYDGGDELMVPLLPGFDRVCYDINGKIFTLKYETVRQHGDIDFGDSNSGSSSSRGYASTSTTIQLIAPETGEIELGIDGQVRGEASERTTKPYHGAVKLPGDGLFSHANLPRSSNFCADSISIPGFNDGAINALQHTPSDTPSGHGSIGVSVKVFNNGNLVFTKTIMSERVSANPSPTVVGGPGSSAGHFVLDRFANSNGITVYCSPDDNQLHRDLAAGLGDGSYMLCSSGMYMHSSTHDFIAPVCHKPSRPTQCGYDVSARFSGSLFTDSIMIENVELGDVIDVEIQAKTNVGITSFDCAGQPDPTLLEQPTKYSGSATINLLNPSVQIQS